MPNPKVPEAVLEAFQNILPAQSSEERSGACVRALAAALAQHHKELLGDEARAAAYGALPRGGENPEDTIGRVIQAAIDSVMKGKSDV